MSNAPLVTIQVVVRNGARYIRHCLDAVRQLTYPNFELVVLDNASDDGTADIVAREYPNARLFRHSSNLGMWPGHEYLLSLTTGEYVLALSVDVIMEKNFLTEAMTVLGTDTAVGAVQGKVFQYAIRELEQRGTAALMRTTIDTCGFGMTKSRKVFNIGHGEPDRAGTSAVRDIFGVEGAVPLFRRSALVGCSIDGHIWDPDYFWYGDDLDLAWRMNLFGYRQVLVPDAVAWHDRSTTKGAAAVPVIGHLRRLDQRRNIPLAKRRLDWSNVRCTIVKNDYMMNILRDLPWILGREVATFAYTLLFEPAVFRETARFVRLLPRMFRRRKLAMRKAIVRPVVIHRWFI